jgi:penicillin-binding protein 1A
MKRVFKTLFILAIALSVLFGVFFYKNIDFSRDEQLFTAFKSQSPTRFYYVNEQGESEEFYTIYTAGAKKEWLSIDELNPNLKAAFLAIEDKNFYSHRGVDVKRTLLAALNSVFHFRPRFGASTITQQLIKNISGDNENTVRRKAEEIIRAFSLERGHTKDEILELYLNIIPMGNGISGVSLASKYYFGREQDELTLAECALLAGITNSPANYNPFSSLEKSIKRRNTVLSAMMREGYIDNQSYEAAIDENPSLSDGKGIQSSVYPWFVETVCNDFTRDYAKHKNMSESAVRMLILNGGLEFYTTMDMRAQSILDEYFSENKAIMGNDNLKFAMAIYNSETGTLSAIVGDKGEKTQNRIKGYCEELITPGSAIKPLSLYAPLIQTEKYNWSSIFDDSPVSFLENSDGEIHEYPKNYPRVYYGNITLCDALTFSKNTVAARVFSVLDTREIYSTLKNKLCLNTIIESERNSKGEVLSDMALAPLALGQLTRGVSLRSLTEAYSVFVSDGVYKEGISYTAVTNSKGEIIYENKQDENQVFSRECARITAQLLCEVTSRGTAKKITLDELFDTGGKTGTSGLDLDRTFIGFTPYFVAGIWCGYKDGKTPVGYMEKSHIEIWDEIMTRIHTECVDYCESTKRLNTDGLIRLAYCRDSGMLVSENCLYDLRGARVDYGYFTPQNAPKSVCKTHVKCYFNQRDGKIYDQPDNTRDYTRISLLDIEIRDMPIDIVIEDEKYSVNKRRPE